MDDAAQADEQVAPLVASHGAVHVVPDPVEDDDSALDDALAPPAPPPPMPLDDVLVVALVDVVVLDDMPPLPEALAVDADVDSPGTT